MVQYVHAEGPVGRHGVLHEGDEILEVGTHTHSSLLSSISSVPPPPLFTSLLLHSLSASSLHLLHSLSFLLSSKVNGTELVGLQHNKATEVVKDMPTHVTFVVCRPLPKKDTAEPQLTGVCNEYHYDGHYLKCV